MHTSHYEIMVKVSTFYEIICGNNLVFIEQNGTFNLEVLQLCMSVSTLIILWIPKLVASCMLKK